MEQPNTTKSTDSTANCGRPCSADQHTSAIHGRHLTLLPLAWDATPGLVEASYCLLTQVAFNTVTTCLRCYSGTCWGVLLSPDTSTIQHCYHLLEMLPGNCWGVLLSPYTSTIQHCYHLLEMLPGTCWGVLLSPYTSTIQHCYHLLDMLPWDLLRRLTVSLHYTIQHCYHLLEMLPQDLLRRLTVSLHKYHSTLLPLAWDATPGLVEATYCLLTQVPFNIVTTCLRCYPGTC